MFRRMAMTGIHHAGGFVKPCWEQWCRSEFSGAKGLARTCMALMHRAPSDAEEGDGSSVFHNTAFVNCLIEDVHQQIHCPDVKYIPTETMLMAATLYLRLVTNDSINASCRKLLDSTLDVIENIVNNINGVSNRRLSGRWHMDGRFVHQLVLSYDPLFLDTQKAEWFKALAKLIHLAIVTHFGPPQLAFLRKSTTTPTASAPSPFEIVSDDLDRIQQAMTGKFADPSFDSVTKERQDYVMRSSMDFCRVMTPTASLKQKLITAVRLSGTYPSAQKLATRFIVFLEYPLSARLPQWGGTTVASNHNPDLDAFAHIVVRDGVFWTTGYFKDMLHRIEQRVDLAIYQKYLADHQSIQEWLRNLQRLIPTLSLVSSSKDAVDDGHGGAGGAGGGGGYESLLKRLRAAEPQKPSKKRKKDVHSSCSASSLSTSSTSSSAHSHRMIDARSTLALWHRRSYVRELLQADESWHTVDPLPTVDVSDCLNEHLGLWPKRDRTSGHFFLDGAPDLKSYTDRMLYGTSSDRSISPAVKQQLDLAYEAMSPGGGQLEILSLSDVLRFSNLRGYFISIWQTLVLDGKQAITPRSIAFICAALIYCIDSKDPADHEDYKRIGQILYYYTQRCCEPREFRGYARTCSKQLPLSTIHPLPSSSSADAVDTLGFAPRLFMWLVRSQRVVAVAEVNEVEQNLSVKPFPVEAVSSTKNRPRWVEVLVMMSTMVALHLQSTLCGQKSYLTLNDLLRMTLNATTHNDMILNLTHRWTNASIDYTDDTTMEDVAYVYDDEHTDEKKPHELWKVTRAEIKSLILTVQQVLVRLVGSESNRSMMIKWLESAQKLILNRSIQLRAKDKIHLSQFATFFAEALKALKASKFEKCSAEVVADIIRPANEESANYRIIYVPNTNNKSFKNKNDDQCRPEDAKRRKDTVLHLAKVHKWKFKLSIIQRVADDAGLLPPDLNLLPHERKPLPASYTSSSSSSLSLSSSSSSKSACPNTGPLALLRLLHLRRPPRHLWRRRPPYRPHPRNGGQVTWEVLNARS